MTREHENREHDHPFPPDVEGMILDDERRRSGEFLRDFLARHRHPQPEPSDD